MKKTKELVFSTTEMPLQYAFNTNLAGIAQRATIKLSPDFRRIIVNVPKLQEGKLLSNPNEFNNCNKKTWSIA